MKFCFRGGPRKMAHSVKTIHSCFDEKKNAFADVSFSMISFWVVLTWHFITRNEISFLLK